MVVACVALIVALGGTSVAAVNALAPSSVGPVQLKAGAVTNPKLRNNAVTGAKVHNRSLTAADFVAGSLPRGPAGPAGPAGAAGPAGPAGTVGPVTVRQDAVAVAGGTGAQVQDGAYSTGTVSVNCNPGEKAISAGTGWSDDAAGRELYPEILRRAGLRLETRLERHVNRRTGLRAGEYFESVLVCRAG